MRIQKPKPGKLPKWVKIAIYLIVAIVVVRGELKDVGILPDGGDRDYSAVEEYADKKNICIWKRKTGGEFFDSPPVFVVSIRNIELTQHATVLMIRR